MAKKHLILIHGRATKPSEKEKRRLVKKTLLHGLERVAPEAAEAIRSKDVRFSLAYYGDICNGIMLAADKANHAELTERDPAHNYGPCEPKGSYDAHLTQLLNRASFTKAAYKKLLARSTTTATGMTSRAPFRECSMPWAGARKSSARRPRTWART